MTPSRADAGGRRSRADESLPAAPSHTLGSFLRTWLYMLPGLAFAALFARAAPLLVQEVGLVVVLGVFAMAGAAKSRGLHPQTGPFRLAFQRFPSYCRNVLLLLGGLLACVVAAGLVGRLGVPRPGGRAELAPEALISLALAVPFLWYHWPALVLAYVVPERTGYEHSPRWWMGPPFGLARVLVRRHGSRSGTATVLGAAAVWLLYATVADFLPADAALRAGWPWLTYFIFLPLVVWTAFVETEHLWDRLDAARRADGRDAAGAAAGAGTAGLDPESRTGAGPSHGPPPDEARPEPREPGPRSFEYAWFGVHGPGPLTTPFEEGGVGRWFVYLSNRNVCSYLFEPREIDTEFFRLLHEAFTAGYSTLFVVEKLGLVAPGAAGEEGKDPAEALDANGVGGPYLRGTRGRPCEAGVRSSTAAKRSPKPAAGPPPMPIATTSGCWWAGWSGTSAGTERNAPGRRPGRRHRLALLLALIFPGTDPPCPYSPIQ